MSSPGSKDQRRPTVVRRTRSTGSTPPSAPPTAAPELSAAMYTARVPYDGAARVLTAGAGILALLGSVLVVIADYLPYVVLDDGAVSAPVNAWSLLAQLFLLVVGAGGGGLLVTGRGGRVGLALLAAAAALAPAHLLAAIFDGSSPRSHDLAEYYFGELHTTLVLEPRIGRALAVTGWALIALAGAAAIAAWQRVAERDLIPLEGGRRLAGGTAALCALLAVIAYLVPLGITRIEKYADPSGLVLTRDVTEPRGVLGLAGLGLVAGLLLLVGWLAAAATVGAMSSRVTVVAALAGMAAMLLYSALVNLRDTTAGDELVAGPRFYLLLAAGLLAAGTATYCATVRTRDEMPLRSGELDPFS